MTSSVQEEDEEIQILSHLGLRTAVTYTINKLPEVSAPELVVRVKGFSCGGTSHATVFKSGFVVFSTAGGVRARVHTLKQPCEPVAEMFELRNGNILQSTPLNDSDIVVALDSMEMLHAWDVEPPRLVGSLSIPFGSPSAINAVISVGLIVIGYGCGSLRCVAHNDGSNMRVVQTIKYAHDDKINTVAVYGNTVVVAGEDGWASVWNCVGPPASSSPSHDRVLPPSIRCTARIPHTEPVATVDISAELFVTGTINEIRVYENRKGYRALKLLRCGRDSFPPRRMSLRLLPRGFLVVCGGYHEEASLSFLCLTSGCIQARLQTGLSCTKTFEVLADARVLVSSAVEGEGFSIVSVARGEIHKSLAKYASVRYRRDSLSRKAKLAIMVVSVVASLFTAGKTVISS